MLRDNSIALVWKARNCCSCHSFRTYRNNSQNQYLLAFSFRRKRRRTFYPTGTARGNASRPAQVHIAAPWRNWSWNWRSDIRAKGGRWSLVWRCVKISILQYRVRFNNYIFFLHLSNEKSSRFLQISDTDSNISRAIYVHVIV